LREVDIPCLVGLERFCLMKTYWLPSCRYDAHSGGEREIQRTMLELLNQLDGFDARGDVKVILATNRIESLDPALLRPGRIDRKIEFPLPDIKTKRRIFQVWLRQPMLSLYLCLKMSVT